MKAWNRESRELRLRYAERRAQINLSADLRQAELTYQIDMAKNELHYCNQSMRKDGADIVALKSRLDAAAERIRELSQLKARLEFDRKNNLVAIQREKDTELAKLEAKYSVELDEYGKEVAVL